MEQTQKAWIYALIDPRDNEIKYIGKSIKPKERLREHILKCKTEHTKKGNWIKKLVSLKLEPNMTLLKETIEQEIAYWEEHYIKEYKSNGFTLLNYDDKGVGCSSGMKKQTILGVKKKLSKEVYQYDLEGNLIEIHKSLREAERQTGINHGNISKCCSGKFKHTGGFIFRLGKDSDIQLIKNPNAMKKKVVEIDLDGNIIAEYLSIADAALKTNTDASNVSRVCNGLRPNTKGHIFKFKE